MKSLQHIVVGWLMATAVGSSFLGMPPGLVPLARTEQAHPLVEERRFAPTLSPIRGGSELRILRIGPRRPAGLACRAWALLGGFVFPAAKIFFFGGPIFVPIFNK